jgi:hypothetical protein
MLLSDEMKKLAVILDAKEIARHHSATGFSQLKTVNRKGKSEADDDA